MVVQCPSGKPAHDSMGKPQLIRLRLDDFEGWPRQAAIILRSDRGHVGVFVQWYFSHPGRPASITVQLIPNYARSFFGQREAVVFPNTGISVNHIGNFSGSDIRLIERLFWRQHSYSRSVNFVATRGKKTRFIICSTCWCKTCTVSQPYT